MFWINTKRIIKSGFVGFWRNSFVSLSSVLIMTVTLFVLGSIIFSGAILRSSLEGIQKKVDVNVYFIPNAAEDDILSLQGKLESLPEVASVEYTSRDQALANFKARHENDEITLQALDELGDNPLGAVLNIRARQTSEYEGIAKFLESEAGEAGSFIDKINYYENKAAIDSLSRIIAGGTKIAFGLTIVLIFISILIAFNTIRLSIYISRDEISVMRLVGASNKYIRGPFIVSGIMYGLVSAVLTLAIFYFATYWVSSITREFFGGFDMFSYYLSNFGPILGVIAGTGALLGAAGSFLAVRKYLRV
ncbi:MAG: permease-like cell division protein FtsX [Candidatus Paceibacterota bacterium]|jgi:cell division transport system permease protein